MQGKPETGDSPEDSPDLITPCTKISSTFPLKLFFQLVILTRVVLCPSRPLEDAQIWYSGYFLGILSVLLSAHHFSNH